MDLIPIINLDVTFQRVGIAQHGEQSRLLSLLCSHDLPAPGNDPAARTLLVKLTAIPSDEIKIGLVSFQIPFGIRGVLILSAAPLSRRRYCAAILDTAVEADAFQLHL